MTDATELEQLLRNAPLPFIAARIKRARKSAGPNGSQISHDTLGERCGMYRQNLIALEKGKHRPRIETLLRIAQATGRDARWFVDPEVDPSPFPLDEQAA